MDCKKCGAPMYYPYTSGLCPKCESEALDKLLAEQQAAQQWAQLTDGGLAQTDGDSRPAAIGN